MTYETLERWEAAYLLSLGCELIDTKMKDSDKLVSFIFNDEGGTIKDNLIDFQNDKKTQGFIQSFEQVTRMIRKEQDRSATEKGGKAWTPGKYS